MKNDKRNLLEKLKDRDVKKLQKTIALFCMSGILSFTSACSFEKEQSVLPDTGIVKEIDSTEEIDTEIEKAIEEILDKEEEEIVTPEDPVVTSEEPLKKDNEDFDFSTIDLSNYTGWSIVEALEKNHYDSSFEFRKKLAAYLGIFPYEKPNNDKENLLMLKLLGAHFPTEININSNNNNNSNAINSGNGNNNPNGTNANGAGNTSDTNPAAHSEDGCPECEGTNKDPDHEHIYTEYVYKNKTKEQCICWICGKVKTRNHSMVVESKEYVPEEGSGNHTKKVTKKCKTCDYKKTDKYVEDCSFGSWEFNPEIGMEESACKKCGDTKVQDHNHKFVLAGTKYLINDDNSHSLVGIYECTAKDEKKTSILLTAPHSYGPWKLNPETGEKERFCHACKHKQTLVQTNDHDHDYIRVEEVVPSSENPNQHIIIIKDICKDKDDEKIISTTLENCSYKDWIYDESKGIAEGNCKCGREHESKIDKWTYDKFKKELVGTSTDSLCSFEVREPHAIHKVLKWTYDERTKELIGTCSDSRCDYDGIREAHEHNVINWVYDPKTKELVGTCNDSRCNHEVREAHEHNVINWVYDPKTKELIGTCNDSRCNHEVREAHEHNVINWVYDSKTKELVGTCNDSRCNHEVREAHEHKYEEHEKNIEIIGNDEKHLTIINGICECGDLYYIKKEEDHIYGEWSQNPDDLTKDNQVCSVCMHVHTRDHEEKHEHKYEEIDQKYVDNGDGTHSLVSILECPEDGDRKEEVIKTEVHNAGEWMQNPENSAQDILVCINCGSILDTRKHEEVHEHKYEYLDPITNAALYAEKGINPEASELLRCEADGAIKVVDHAFDEGVFDGKCTTTKTCQHDYCNHKKEETNHKTKDVFIENIIGDVDYCKKVREECEVCHTIISSEKYVGHVFVDRSADYGIAGFELCECDRYRWNGQTGMLSDLLGGYNLQSSDSPVEDTQEVEATFSSNDNLENFDCLEDDRGMVRSRSLINK